MRTPRLGLLVSLLALAALALPQVGCSSREAFRKAAEPLATAITGDITNYLAAMPADSPERAAGETKVTMLNAAVAQGDATGTASVWFGVGNLRAMYEAFMAADPKFSEPGGDDLRAIKGNDIAAFDFIVATGQSQQTPPAGAPPPR